MTPPPLFAHQAELFTTTKDFPAWGVFFQTGVGKSAPTIHTAVHLFTTKKIDAVVIVAPSSVHRNWTEVEVPAHCSIPYRVLDWHSSRAKAQDRALAAMCEVDAKLPWFSLTYDALVVPRGRQAVLDFTKGRRFMLVVDEGSRVKTPTALRTKKVAALRQLAAYVRLLNGTPCSDSPLDLYAQMKILDNQFWIKHGLASWTAFQARFAVTKKIPIGGEDDRASRGSPSREPIVPHDVDPTAYEQLDLSEILSTEEKQALPTSGPAVTGAIGRTINVIVGYRDLDQLHSMIQPLSTRLTKEQAGLNLPPKLYQRLVFELAPEQRRVYDQLRREFMIELDNGALLTAPLAMTRILRLQQIASGFVTNPDDPEGSPILIPGDKNPRLGQFLDWTEDIGKAQSIVWCRFTFDVDLICRTLGPPRCVRYDGKVGEKDKALALDLFRSGKRQFCVAKASSLGMGLTLVNSALSFFYTSSFSLLERLQAEDRQHRIGQHNPVTYVDLEADRTVDGKIIRALRDKNEIAAKVNGDEYRSWLEA